MENIPNNLADEEKSFIGPLMVIGIVAMGAMLLWGMFMPTPEWIW